jgi:hypothetical protein
MTCTSYWVELWSLGPELSLSGLAYAAEIRRIGGGDERPPVATLMTIGQEVTHLFFR